MYANAMICECVDGIPRSPHSPSSSHIAAGRSIFTRCFSPLLSTAALIEPQNQQSSIGVGGQDLRRMHPFLWQLNT